MPQGSGPGEMLGAGALGVRGPDGTGRTGVPGSGGTGLGSPSPESSPEPWSGVARPLEESVLTDVRTEGRAALCAAEKWGRLLEHGHLGVGV